MAWADVITIQPKTLTNIKINDGTTTYNLEDVDYSETTNGYQISIGSGFTISESTLTISADHCVSQQIIADGTGTTTAVMQPAAGYRKLYAWKVYTPACTPTYIYTDTATPTELSALYTNTGERLALSDISYSSYVAGSITYATSNSIQFEPVSGATVPIK